jgi:hypothetical protein
MPKDKSEKKRKGLIAGVTVDVDMEDATVETVCRQLLFSVTYAFPQKI